MTDVFCKIIEDDSPDQYIYRDERVVVIRDISPQAPVHLLVLPRVHVDGISDVSEEDDALLGHLLRVADKVAQQEGLEKGYRLIVNEGEHGGKAVPHLHVHVLGGKPLGGKLI